MPSISGAFGAPVTTIMATSPWRTDAGLTVTLKAAAGAVAPSTRVRTTAARASALMPQFYAGSMKPRSFPAWPVRSVALRGFGALLPQEPLDLRHEVARRRQRIPLRGGRLRALVFVGGLALELPNILGDLGILAYDLLEIVLELLRR